MLLKMTYKFNDIDESVEIKCSNYTFGLPVLFGNFHTFHPEGLIPLQKAGIVTDVVIRSFYNGSWKTLQSARISFK